MLYSTNEFFDGYTVVKYEPQSICNKSCSYCYVRDKETGTDKDLIISDLTAILSAENPKIVLGIEGGEPILQNGFDEIVDHIYKTKKYENHKFCRKWKKTVETRGKKMGKRRGSGCLLLFRAGYPLLFRGGGQGTPSSEEGGSSYPLFFRAASAYPPPL